MQHMILNSELSRFAALRRDIKNAEPDIDEPTLADTLEGATDLREAITAVIRSALDDETMAEALKGRMAAMTERRQRIVTRAKAKRAAATRAMDEADIAKITAPDMTLSLRLQPAGVTITDETLIPEWFWIPQDPKLDRARLRDALKAGTAVDGAALSDPERSLSVRVK